MLEKTTDAHLEADHVVFEDTRGYQTFEFRLEAGELRQIGHGSFAADDSTSSWGCIPCRIDTGLAPPTIEQS